MPRNGIMRTLFWLAAVWLLAGIRPALAQEPRSVAPACHAYSALSVGFANLDQLEWDCSGDGWRDGAQVAWLRFPAGWIGAPATEFSSRITVFRQIEIAAFDATGPKNLRTYKSADARTIVDGAVFALDLPPAPQDNRYWIVRIERPHSLTVQTEARISQSGLHTHGSLIAIAILTFVLGMLVMPLLFDIGFFVVLRERFVLLHAGMIISMIGYVLFSGGLASLVTDIPLNGFAVLGPLSWAVGVGLAGFFIRAFLEKDVLTPLSRRTITFFAWWSILVPGFASLQIDAFQTIDNLVYFYGFLPVIPIYSAIILRSLFLGSRAACFLAAAWAPIIAASSDRLLRGLGVYTSHSSLDLGMFIAIGLEVIIIALGVADRFLALRRQRDLAVREARSMEEAAERDPLTGLYNRRVLEERFQLLRAEGFTTLAVLDLDHFKDVNDTYGHAVGDRVLQAVAAVLKQDDDLLAFRMGGEEFLLLKRGPNAMQHAEQRRQAIPTRVAAEVEGLDCMVTASMGIIEVPRNAMPSATFEELYERADRLLYDAKQGGRNRTVSERLRVFAPRHGERRGERSGDQAA